MARRVPLIIVSTVLALGSATGCGAAKAHTLDATSAAHAISTNLATSTGLDAPVVHCPSGVVVKRGGTFDCTTMLDGQPLTIHGALTDSHGRFTVKPGAAILIVAKAAVAIEAQVNQQRGTGPQPVVDCGSRPVLVKAPGETFECTAEAGGITRVVTVTVTNIEGQVRFQVAPAGTPTSPTTAPPFTGSAGTTPPPTIIGGGGGA